MIDIKNALFQAFLDHTDLDEDNIAIPNVNFDIPEDDAIWARMTFIPNIPVVATLGNLGYDDTNGILQIDFNAPQGTGDKEILRQANCAREYFSAGRYFKYNKKCVMVTSSGYNNGLIIDNFFRVTFTVNWYAQLTRNINSNT